MAYTNIDDPSAYFQIATYTGNATDDTAITYDGNSDMQPDWLWFKLRSASGNHVLFDSTRGTSKYVRTNNPNNETTNGTLLKSFDSDGFTVGTAGNTNSNGNTLVSWGWKANGGTTSSNTDGDITSTVQADTTAGFSIMTYSGTTGDVHTIGHGLGVTPQVWIVKQRSSDGEFGDWFFWHHQMAASNIVDNRMLFLNSTAAVATYTGINAVTSSTIRVKSSTTAQNGDTYVAYAFAEKQGYSKFGKYTGNGDANGTFVYTGFKPAFVLIKRSDAVNDWLIYDHKRSGYNPKQDKLYPNSSSSEDASTTSVDLLSNGFKLRASSASQNASGGDYIYMAFGENPFTTSTGIPTTAR